MRRYILLLVLLLLPFAAAQNTSGDLTADAVELRDATVDLEPRILKLLAGNGTLPTTFHLEAAHLRMEQDTAQRVLGADETRTFLLWDTTPSTHQDATITALRPDDETRWALDFPAGTQATATLTAPCLTAEPAPKRSEFSFAVIDQNRPTRTTPVADTVRLRPCSEATLTITGDFRIAVWDWNFHLTDEDRQTVQTGVYPRSDGTGDQATEAYLFAQNATLTIKLPGDVASFFAATATAVAPRVTLHNAHGPLHLAQRDLELRGEDRELEGDLTAAIAGTGRNAPLDVELDGTTTATNVLQPLPGVAKAIPSWVAWLIGFLVLSAIELFLLPAKYYNRISRRAEYTGEVIAHTIMQRRRAGITLLALHSLEKEQFGRAIRLAQRSTPANVLHSEAMRILGAARLHKSLAYPEGSAQSTLLQAAGANAIELALSFAVNAKEKARAMLALAHYWLQAHDADEAIRLFEAAQEYDPETVEPYKAYLQNDANPPAEDIGDASVA